jgi:Icc-related predicted phosphoesterase
MGAVSTLGYTSPMIGFIDGRTTTGRAALEVRLAAVGDLHVRARGPLPLAAEIAALGDSIDALVIAGDITEGGRLPEAERAAELLAGARVPVVAVLGNHDLRTLRRRAFRQLFERRGIALLDGEAAIIRIAGNHAVGFAGISGCGGGFWPDEGPDALHSRASRALALRAKREAGRLQAALDEIAACDLRVVITHFAPTATTLGREPIAKYWMLGNCELGRVIDRATVDLAIHGHAHLGNADGRTAGGTPVRNVSLAVGGGLARCTIKIGPPDPAPRPPATTAWLAIGGAA